MKQVLIGILFTLFSLRSNAVDSEVDCAFQKLFSSAKQEDVNKSGADFITKLVVAPSDQRKTQSTSTLAREVRNTGESKVRVEVYYEALCPYCQAFMGGALTDVLRRKDIIN